MFIYEGHMTVVFTDKNDKVKCFHVQDIQKNSNSKKLEKKLINQNIKRIEYIVEQVTRNEYSDETFSIYKTQEEISDFATRWNLYF